MATSETPRGRLDLRAAVWAGIIAGMIFMMLEMVLVFMFMGQSPWGPPRMIAAILLGKEVLPPPDTFDEGIMAVAMVVHFPLSVAYAILLAALMPGAGRGATVWGGAVFGLILYLVNFYLFTGIFPWFAMARNWVSVFNHIMFGLVAGWAYASLRRPVLAGVAARAREVGGWDGVNRRYPGGVWSGPERRRA